MTELSEPDRRFMRLLVRHPGAMVDWIAERTEWSAGSVRNRGGRLAERGLIKRDYTGEFVFYTLTPDGKKALR